MKYMGSKNRIAKYILPLILNGKYSGTYIEPFCGGANIIDKVPCSFTRIGNDSNLYLIELLKYVQSGGTLPDYITEDEYKKVQNNKPEYPQWYVGFVGFSCSFGAKFFGGFARNIRKGSINEHLNKTTRNYCDESARNLLRQASSLNGIIFMSGNYQDIPIPDDSIIYCDPPYKNTTSYKDTFDHSEFYEWLRLLNSLGHSIFISEYDMPNDFMCIWQKEVVSSFDHSSRKKETEKLFTL